MANAGAEDAAPRLRPLLVTLFGEPRALGDLPTCAHSDAIAIAQWLARCAKSARLSTRAARRGAAAPGAPREGAATAPAEALGGKRSVSQIAALYPRTKRLRLSDARAARVEAALRDGGVFPSLDALRRAVEAWCEASVAGFDAAAHYDARRAKGYTAANRENQRLLAQRTLELLPEPRGDLLLDVACGSGLSAAAARDGGGGGGHHFVVGTDVSDGMLRVAAAEQRDGYVDFVLADMRHPLPFREGSFDSAISVSALHYVSEADAATQRCCLGSMLRTLWPRKGGAQAVCQLFPARAEESMEQLARAALAAGWALARPVLGPTRAQSLRWFLVLQGPPSIPRDVPECRVQGKRGVSCVLCLPWLRKLQPEAACVALATAEHARTVRRLLRCLSREPSLLETHLVPLARACADAFSEEEQVPTLDEVKRALHGQGGGAARLDRVLHPEPKA